MGSAPSSSTQSPPLSVSTPPPPQPIPVSSSLPSSITSPFSVFIIIVHSNIILGTLSNIKTWKSAYNGSNSITTSTNGNGINVVTDRIRNRPAIIIVPDTVQVLDSNGNPSIGQGDRYTIILQEESPTMRLPITHIEQLNVRAYLVHSGQYKLAYINPSNAVASRKLVENVDNSIKPSNDPVNMLVFRS